ncbi:MULTISPECIES: hypothetical protein [Aestuariibaculum]|uniref:DUF2116 family Zn-ribbon domain-containing protein n=1 Tax=Aestuariibaculum sediminum TaxID=2770637 RepID=A0A8J6QAR2_9FLAO|nr:MULTISPECIES: hypothetical protein [Aestuariibaculum]MBD0833757.1 hypothetical protein [Aestuariibaculum sediminum]WMI64798.1 hypothetical protein RBH94_12085 [Aestuariibaculum sp. YM273]
MKRNGCKSCGKELTGRSDKVFCDLHCKSSYHYRRSLEEAPRFYNQVDNQLKLNRKILKSFNKAGKATVRANVLKEQGFNSKFFTHYWKNQKGDVYLFVYEYGFLKKKEQNLEKYILIQWQDYMN